MSGLLECQLARLKLPALCGEVGDEAVDRSDVVVKDRLVDVDAADTTVVGIAGCGNLLDLENRFAGHIIQTPPDVLGEVSPLLRDLAIDEPEIDLPRSSPEIYVGTDVDPGRCAITRRGAVVGIVRFSHQDLVGVGR